MLLDDLIQDVESQRTWAREQGAATAVSTLTTQLVKLQKERAAVEAEDVSPLTDDEIREIVADLTDDQLPIVAAALKERTAGRR